MRPATIRSSASVVKPVSKVPPLFWVGVRMMLLSGSTS